MEKALKMFVEGRRTPADDSMEKVADAAFAEAGPAGLLLAPRRGRLTRPPRDPAAWPDPAHPDWRRRNAFASG